jgi:hypothetical protein
MMMIKYTYLHTIYRQFVQVQGDSNGASITQSTLKPDSKTDYNTFGGGASTYVIDVQAWITCVM